MDKLALIVGFVLWTPVFSEIISRPFTGHQEDHVHINEVEIESTESGERKVTIVFTATDIPQVLWEVGGKAVMYYDTRFVTMSSDNTASLRVARTNRDQIVKFSIILRVYQESIIIHLANANSGRYVVSNHTLVVTPGEGFMYSSEDMDNVNIDAVLWVDDVSRYHRLRLNSMLIIPDYCSRPIKPLFGFPSSNPDMLEMASPNISKKFVGENNWIRLYPADNSASKRFRITSVFRPSQKQGMLVIGSDFDASSPSDPIRNIHTIRRIFFKPAPLFQDFILRNTVTFIGWQHDLVVNLNNDADIHIFAIGNPTPRIMLAKNGADISTMVERRDIQEAYFKHSIFRFRNVTMRNAGRYICTATSGDGRIKQTFTLYVSSPCNPSK